MLGSILQFTLGYSRAAQAPPRIAIVEKKWSEHGSLQGGHIIALRGEAGYQAKILRGGVHFGLYPFKYSLHRVPLITVAEGRIAYVYARDGEALPPIQALGRVVDCSSFQDAEGFLQKAGQRGRQRAILREGVYAVNTALFVVVTEDAVYGGPQSLLDKEKFKGWQEELMACGGFMPVVIGFGGRQGPDVPPIPSGITPDLPVANESDQIGVVTIHDGPTIPAGEIIAPAIGADGQDGHNYFQDPERFIALGGFRGKQLQVLTDGTFFLNRWFATVEIKPKTLIPIGYVGVVVGYYGQIGKDTTGEAFRYGEQVGKDERGVWKRRCHQENTRSTHMR